MQILQYHQYVKFAIMYISNFDFANFVTTLGSGVIVYLRSRYHEQNREQYRGAIVSQRKPKFAL